MAMDIYRAQKIAEDRMAAAIGGEWDNSFTLVGPLGEIKAKWLDPYFGLFQIEGQKGFTMVKSIPQDITVRFDEPEVE